MTDVPSADLAWLLVAFLAAVVTVAGTVAGKALMRGFARVLAALVEIGRLPDVVGELIDELRSLRGHLSALGDRVKHLEEMAGAASVQADVSFTHHPEGQQQ